MSNATRYLQEQIEVKNTHHKDEVAQKGLGRVRIF